MAVRGQSLVGYAVNERKPRVFEGEPPASRAGLRALLRQVGAGPKLVAFEAGNQRKWIAEMLKKSEGVQGQVVHPNAGKWITESRGKTDRVEAQTLAERARAGSLPRAVQVVEGAGRALRDLVRARQPRQSKRMALSTPIRGDVDQDGHRLPEQCFARAAWREQGARLPVSAPLRLIRETFLTSSEAGQAAEQRLTARLRAMEEPRGPLLERIPAIGPLAARVLVSALDEAQRFEESKAVANSGALAPTISQRGAVRQ